MNFIGAAVSDKGIVKQTNQDSVCIKIANTSAHGQVALVIICDGMGGLAQGEVASATVVKHFSDWFERELPNMLIHFEWDRIEERWDFLIKELNTKLIEYGKEINANLGTTLTMMLCVDNQYMIAHVGDSRAYCIKDSVLQLTEDHTFIAREIKAGNMTYEQAMQDPRRNMLLQCVGASREVNPDYIRGTLSTQTIYMFCSDGFRHMISAEEMYENLNSAVLFNQEQMNNNCRQLVEIIKSRNERDNISVAVLKTL